MHTHHIYHLYISHTVVVNRFGLTPSISNSFVRFKSHSFVGCAHLCHAAGHFEGSICFAFGFVKFSQCQMHSHSASEWSVGVAGRQEGRMEFSFLNFIHCDFESHWIRFVVYMCLDVALSLSFSLYSLDRCFNKMNAIYAHLLSNFNHNWIDCNFLVGK